MAVKIRLARRGRAKNPFYHIIVADSRSPRDGRFIEKIGSYNPLTQPATIEIDREKAFDWLMKGAQPTDTVRSILRFKGVMYRLHLAKGVRKGALTQDQADQKYNEFINQKDDRIAKRFEAVRKAKDESQRKIAGTDMPIKIAELEVPKSNSEEE
jgi:small subunit ribosomal protein S16